MEKADAARLRELSVELDTVRLDRESSVSGVLAPIRTLLGADNLLLLCPVERPDGGWEVERLQHDQFPAVDAFGQRFLDFFRTAPRRYAWYDASRPEPAQRNRVIDALDIIPPGEYEASRIYDQVMRPSGVHRHRQPRALLCDGPALLGWFGSFHAKPFDRRQTQLLAGVVPSMQRRLRMERQLRIGPRQRAILEHVLDHLGAPAFVVGARGQILETSRSGGALLETRRDEIAAALQAALAHRQHPIAIELTPIADAGTPLCWLAIVRAGSADARIASAVAMTSVRWQLTARRRDVLELVLRGHANTTIAGLLGVSDRAVELHVTALLDRAGAESRTALVSAVLSV